MRKLLAVVVPLVFFASTPAFAQGFIPLPNQLSAGVGAVHDRQPSQNSPAFAFSFAFADSGSDYWPSRFGLVWEGELGTRSDVESCRDRQSVDSTNCDDAVFQMGTRFHFFRRASRRALPFVNLLLGSYWKGSGAEDHAFLPGSFTYQLGGGLDLRRARSVHGLRLAVDYRQVFAGDQDRNQLRFATLYVLGPP